MSTRGFDQVGRREEHGARDEARFHAEATPFGRLMIREDWTLPAPRLRFGTCSAVVRITRDAQSADVIAHVLLEFVGAENETVTASLDEAETRATDAALDYMLKNVEACVRGAKTYTEVEYRLSSGIRVGFYVCPGEKWAPMIGGDRHSFFPIELREVKQLFEDALFRIQLARDIGSVPPSLTK